MPPRVSADPRARIPPRARPNQGLLPRRRRLPGAPGEGRKHGGRETSGSENDATGDPTPSLESEFARVLREQTERATRAMETRWTQGGLRPRVVHESTSDWIRRVAFDWPNAVMGTAAGSVLVCNCEELGGLEYRERARRLLARRKDAHSRDWRAVEDRGLGERSLLGLYDAGAVTASHRRRARRVGGPRRQTTRVANPTGADVDDPAHPSATARRCARGCRGAPGRRHGCRVRRRPADACGRRASTGRSVDGGFAGNDARTTTTMMRTTRRWSSSGNGPRVRRRCASPWTRTRGFVRRHRGRSAAVALDARSLDTAVDTADTTVSSLTIGATLRAWTAHEDGVTRSVSHARGGCLTGSSTGRVRVARRASASGASVSPSLAAKMIGHAAAVVSISTGNPRHVVSGAHDGTVRVWNAPDLSADDEDGEERGGRRRRREEIGVPLRRDWAHRVAGQRAGGRDADRVRRREQHRDVLRLQR